MLDSSILARSLELSIQLIEMNIPMVIALNMFDEAQKKGIEIDLKRLSFLTGVEVYPTSLSGSGVQELFDAAFRVARNGSSHMACVRQGRRGVHRQDCGSLPSGLEGYDENRRALSSSSGSSRWMRSSKGSWARPIRHSSST